MGLLLSNQHLDLSLSLFSVSVSCLTFVLVSYACPLSIWSLHLVFFKRIKIWERETSDTFETTRASWKLKLWKSPRFSSTLHRSNQFIWKREREKHFVLFSFRIISIFLGRRYSVVFPSLHRVVSSRSGLVDCIVFYVQRLEHASQLQYHLHCTSPKAKPSRKEREREKKGNTIDKQARGGGGDRCIENGR